jgi:hypothetical protein
VGLDQDGNAYVTGATSSSGFPTTSGAFQTARGGGSDGFVTKLNATGGGLSYSSLLGGAGYDAGRGIHVAPFGRATVAGLTGSADFPTTPGAYRTALAGGSDAFVTQVRKGGKTLRYSTLLGGSAADVANDVFADASGDAYVTGVTESTDFPVAGGAPQPALGGLSDAFAAKLVAGTSLTFATFLGGSEADAGQALAVNASGDAYVTGVSQRGFPTTPGAFQGGYDDSTFPSDAFVTKVDVP